MMPTSHKSETPGAGNSEGFKISKQVLSQTKSAPRVGVLLWSRYVMRTAQVQRDRKIAA